MLPPRSPASLETFGCLRSGAECLRAADSVRFASRDRGKRFRAESSHRNAAPSTGRRVDCRTGAAQAHGLWGSSALFRPPPGTEPRLRRPATTACPPGPTLTCWTTTCCRPPVLSFWSVRQPDLIHLGQTRRCVRETCGFSRLELTLVREALEEVRTQLEKTHYTKCAAAHLVTEHLFDRVRGLGRLGRVGGRLEDACFQSRMRSPPSF